jgi:hypothetical protein
MSLKTKILSGLVGLAGLVHAAIATALPVRPIATATITPINTARLNNITNAWGGNIPRVTGPDFGQLLIQAMSVYPDAMGQIAWVIIFAIPFVMMWIVQADMTMPAIVGMLFSLYIFLKISPSYGLFALGCFAICTASLLWSLYKRAY